MVAMIGRRYRIGGRRIRGRSTQLISDVERASTQISLVD